jgi:hypothetical protein
MVKQFLLNPDGSIPFGANLAKLQAESIPLVLPTQPPREPGMIAVEMEPELDAEGVWRQVWKLEPSPEPAPKDDDLLASLTPEQRTALLALLSN